MRWLWSISRRIIVFQICRMKTMFFDILQVSLRLGKRQGRLNTTKTMGRSSNSRRQLRSHWYCGNNKNCDETKRALRRINQNNIKHQHFEKCLGNSRRLSGWFQSSKFNFKRSWISKSGLQRGYSRVAKCCQHLINKFNSCECWCDWCVLCEWENSKHNLKFLSKCVTWLQNRCEPEKPCVSSSDSR